MRPIIIEISKDTQGRELVTLPIDEFYNAIDRAYETGVIDGRRLEEQQKRALEILAQTQTDINEEERILSL